MRFDIVTIFPEFFGAVFDYGIVRRARLAGLVQIEAHDLRRWTHDRHKVTDDRPFGGGDGMVMKPEPIFEAVEGLAGAGEAEALATDEVSIGDYVLSGGEPAAVVLVDAVTRLVPGALGSETSAVNESFSEGLLDFPHYTRPPEFRGMRVPEVLLGGNHAEIARWRRTTALGKTRRNRPDLFEKLELPADERTRAGGDDA